MLQLSRHLNTEFWFFFLEQIDDYLVNSGKYSGGNLPEGDYDSYLYDYEVDNYDVDNDDYGNNIISIK